MIGATDSVTLLADGAATTDAEGRVTRPDVETTVDEARVDELSARDVEIAAQVGQTHDIAVKVPLGTTVTDRMRVRVDAAGDRSHLLGTFEIDAVRTTRLHLRLLCSRTTIQD